MIKNGFNGKGKGCLTCKGNLSIKYIENGFVQCEKDIHIERGIINSTVKLNGTLSILGKKGSIMGGEIYAGEKLVSTSLGSKSGVKTRIFLGYNFKIKDMLQELKNKKIQFGFQLNKIEMLLNKLFRLKKKY